MDIDAVAEAIHKAQFDHRFWPCFDTLCMDQTRRMAQAAIDALQLTQEERATPGTVDAQLAKEYGIEVAKRAYVLSAPIQRRLASPWVEVNDA